MMVSWGAEVDSGRGAASLSRSSSTTPSVFGGSCAFSKGEITRVNVSDGPLFRQRLTAGIAVYPLSLGAVLRFRAEGDRIHSRMELHRAGSMRGRESSAILAGSTDGRKRPCCRRYGTTRFTGVGEGEVADNPLGRHVMGWDGRATMVMVRQG